MILHDDPDWYVSDGSEYSFRWWGMFQMIVDDDPNSEVCSIYCDVEVRLRRFLIMFQIILHFRVRST